MTQDDKVRIRFGCEYSNLVDDIIKLRNEIKKNSNATDDALHAYEARLETYNRKFESIKKTEFETVQMKINDTAENRVTNALKSVRDQLDSIKPPNSLLKSTLSRSNE